MVYGIVLQFYRTLCDAALPFQAHANYGTLIRATCINLFSSIIKERGTLFSDIQNTEIRIFLQELSHGYYLLIGFIDHPYSPIGLPYSISLCTYKIKRRKRERESDNGNTKK